MDKIAFFLSALDGGGAERVMINLASGLIEKGVDIELILSKAEGPYLAQIPSNVPIIDLQKERLIQSLPALITYLQKNRPTILITALEDASLIAIWARWLSQITTQIIVTVHNNLSLEIRNATQLKRKLSLRLASKFYAQADTIVAVSQGVAEDLQELGISKEKIVPIYNPILTPELSQKLQQTIEHPWLDPGQPPVILGVGRLTKQKDFPTLIKAFHKVQQQQSVRLMILGEGEERPHLEALVHTLELSENVLFPGFVDNPYVYMAKAAVVVLSSAWEGFGNILVESMAAGTPVVSTNCESGPSEILAEGKYGILVTVGDVDAMATAITAILKETPDSERLKKRADYFSLENAVRKYENLFLRE